MTAARANLRVPGSDSQKGWPLTLPAENPIHGIFPSGMPEALSNAVQPGPTTTQASILDTSNSAKAPVGHDNNTAKVASDANSALKPVPFTFTSSYPNNGAFASTEVRDRIKDYSRPFLGNTTDKSSPLMKSSIFDTTATAPSILEKTQPNVPESSTAPAAGGNLQGGDIWDRAKDVKLTGSGQATMSHNEKTAASAVLAENLVESDAPSVKRPVFAGTSQPQGKRLPLPSFTEPTTALTGTTIPPAAGNDIFHFKGNPLTSVQPPVASPASTVLDTPRGFCSDF